jgi:hypothetical protein
MSEQPRNEPVADEQLEDATGGSLDVTPGGTGGTLDTSGPENDIGATSC